jgi:hypothetical protein
MNTVIVSNAGHYYPTLIGSSGYVDLLLTEILLLLEMNNILILTGYFLSLTADVSWLFTHCNIPKSWDLRISL